MSKEAIIERILSDAQAESDAIIAEAKAQADAIIKDAEAHAAERQAETDAEDRARAQRILDGRAASARLESAKILLAEKRRVLDEIYARALGVLLTLSERESVKLYERLLTENAEEGDEVVFARCFAFAEDAAKLPIIAERKLKISEERADLDGGFLLRGKNCDKDVSFPALLTLDREQYQSELAEKLFRESESPRG